MRRRYRSKEDWLIEHIRGAKVLYIGSVDASAENFEKHQQTQEMLHAHRSGVLGVYYSRQQVETLRQAGLSAVVANVQSLELGDTFDSIVASDNLEHLTNCGAFLEGVRRHLAEGGRALVSTPNPASVVRLLELAVLGQSKANSEHTCWFTGQVMDQIARRYGLHITSSIFIDEMRKYHRVGMSGSGRSVMKRLLSLTLVAINGAVCLFLPQFSETFGFVLEHVESNDA